MRSASRPPTVHLIGNAHIDPVWLWRWQEGFAETKATFRSALDRMRETPDYVFTASSAALYAWVEESDPEMFREIQERVAQGRWAVAGGWWIEPDCNIPGGESLVRQGLYGQRYFREKFGRLCTVGYCVDSFGHAGELPKILRGCRLHGYVFMRPQEHENGDIPPLAFRWQAGDRSQVVALRIPRSYNAAEADALAAKIEHNVSLAAGTPLGDQTFAFYGIGNHGGGPTQALLARITEWRQKGRPWTLRYAGPEDVTELAGRRKLPVWSGEMQHHARGCYAAVSAIKQGNRRAESALVTAEMWGAAAMTESGRVPATAALGAAWRDVLFNQFHDILAGSSVAAACDDAVRQQGAAVHAAEAESNAARQSISWRIDTRGEGAPLIVFNHHPFSYSGLVETEDVGFLVSDDDGGEMALKDAAGQPVPCQAVTPQTICGRRRFVVRVHVPALGYCVLRQGRVRPGSAGRLLGDAVVRVRARRHKSAANSGEERPQPAAARAGAPRRASRVGGRGQPAIDGLPGAENSLQNEFLRLGLTRDGNAILYDRHRRRQVLGAAGAVPMVVDDHSDTWSHGVDSYPDVAGRFTATRAEVIERGPVRARLAVHYVWQDSRLTLEYSLGAGEPFVRLRGRVDWREHWQLVKLSFPVPYRVPEWTAEAPFGTAVRRANGEEEPVQRWVDISAGDRGLAIANDGRYSCSAEPRELRVTILRSPPYAFHDPFRPDDFGHHPFTDQGVQDFQLVLVPHPGDWREAGIMEIARQLNQPPSTLSETFHAGPLPSRTGFAECHGKGVYIEAIKEAEEGDGLIVRAGEWFGRSRKARFKLPGASQEWGARFRPGEVKTFRVPTRGGGRPVEVDMLEE